ncbi:Lar family restriction alleviation protein [Aquaspirillum serpens]|uniref:Lar family restriction alleviation protein n=1 Tax=Aquaspirillum serpens TaxID=190 RepID=UPI00047F25D8|nr:Lar family restriction alleviation protein [Aquaspirillum serpens]
MTSATPDPTVPKPCQKCGSPAEVVKAGSRRFWVQCSRYPKQGNCSTIGAQADNRKEAILLWNRSR